jgi:ElaB/YqjD/DUF883 family membrane-anchored ribosome-binding protein
VDEATRTSGSPVGDEQDTRSPEEIRADIENTREDLGDTVEALAAKTDVKGQAKAKVESVKEKVTGAKDGAADRTPESAQHGFEQVKSTASDNPVPTAAVAAFVGGLLVGVILARRR